MTPFAPPTRRRLASAVAAGNVPVSSVLVTHVALVAGLLALPAALENAHAVFEGLLTKALSEPQPLTDASALVALALAGMHLVLPVAAAAAIAALLAAAVQSGGNLIRHRRARSEHPRWSDGRLYGLFRSLVVAIALGTVATVAVRMGLREAANPPHTAAGAASAALTVIERGVWALVATFGVIALGDAIVTRIAWRRALWMTREELDEERRLTEPSPLITRERRRAGRAARLG